MIEEIFRPIPFCPGQYEASNLGRIRRLHRTNRAKTAGQTLRAHKSKIGYLSVTLSIGNERKTHNVHRLVAIAFLGEPNGLTVNHKDGDKTNNRLDNLEYITQFENNRHAVDTGLRDLRGSKNRSAKLTEEQVAEIRRLYAAKQGSTISLGKRFGVKQSTIHRIVTGKNWKCVPQPVLEVADAIERLDGAE